jgi:hypothetical protein
MRLAQDDEHRSACQLHACQVNNEMLTQNLARGMASNRC